MAQTVDTDSQLPLKGVVLCYTSIAQDVRTKLADAASQMGAIHKLDLTSDVTHLLVGATATPKYRYVAKDRPDIKPLAPAFIDAVREVWMEGGDVDLGALEKEHMIPPFSGLQICLTGFEDMSKRKEIEETVKGNGGRYNGDLTKHVTHLIAARPEGPKYTHAKQWQINVVSLKWIEDCLVRGMALDETLYRPELPLEQQGKGAFRTKRPLDKRPREAAPVAAGEKPGRKKMRKSASMRLDSQSQDMWRDISAQEVQVDNTEMDAWNDESQSAAPVPRPASRHRPEAPAEPAAHREQNGLFSGHFILIQGFDDAKARKLKRFLEPNGATIVQSPNELEAASGVSGFQSRCLLMPHAQPIVLPGVPPGTILVTEWWVERCIHYRRHLDPQEDSLSSPLTNALVTGFASLTISTSGFGSVDLRQTAEAVKLMGATYQESLSPNTSVLVCAAENLKREKALYATKHGIPVVSADWLWASYKDKQSVSFDRFRISLEAFDAKELRTSSPAASTERSDNRSSRGSGQDAKWTDDLLQPKRLSNTRKRHAVPALQLKAPAPKSSKLKPRSGPFVYEEDEDDAVIVNNDPPAHEEQAGVQDPLSPPSDGPLREISPNASQQRSQHGGDLGRGEADKADPFVPEKKGKTAELEAPIKSPKKSPKRSPVKDGGQGLKTAQELTSNLASLLGRKDSDNPGSSGGPQKRKHRPLGRNLSGISNRSASASGSPALPAEVSESMDADGFHFSKMAPELPPSTQLGYETPEVEAHLREMSKKMGTTLLPDELSGRRVSNKATVKDSSEVVAKTSAMAAVGSRAKVRTRAKG
ncbi:S-M checkpoint control protein rad4 [Fulvia fulva]|uniref:S-M checkpoint control protein rad4 n=1 Tax=Passalora fulva TaxID=5499 RepID=A0A9Q8P512_PASFU|nr:S-M checkpoint control protein rad4 [Fulvia fulva]KAK4633509.1 S-M checkpoint control protein rad4 [Fulvia fulva]UJO13424.1 S-M checkpoint control protein rad4 [Fulvia fulva]WPV11075.1 S-M checkpoint control protein rad4 [Fulvia fulva]